MVSQPEGVFAFMSDGNREGLCGLLCQSLQSSDVDEILHVGCDTAISLLLFWFQAMEGSMLTLSLANWMELPELKLKDWMREKRRFGSLINNVLQGCIEKLQFSQ